MNVGRCKWTIVCCTDYITAALCSCVQVTLQVPPFGVWHAQLRESTFCKAWVSHSPSTNYCSNSKSNAHVVGFLCIVCCILAQSVGLSWIGSKLKASVVIVWMQLHLCRLSTQSSLHGARMTRLDITWPEEVARQLTLSKETRDLHCPQMPRRFSCVLTMYINSPIHTLHSLVSALCTELHIMAVPQWSCMTLGIYTCAWYHQTKTYCLGGDFKL